MFLHDGLSLKQVEIAVELQQPCRGAPDFGDSENACSRANEVSLPSVFSWIEQSNREIGVWVEAEEVGAFVQIAAHAGKGEILFYGLPAMLFGDDMLDMKRRVDFVLHAETAIFTAASSPFPHLLSQLRVQDQAALKFWRNTPAFRRRMDISFPA